MSDEIKAGPEGEPEDWERDEAALRRARRRGCIVKLAILWFSIMAAVILVMIFVRSRVHRDAAEIETYLSQRIAFQPPEGFYAYSMSHFAGSRAISYWHERHVREDGRTTSVIGFYTREEWLERDAAEVAAAMLSELEERLDRNEFHANSKETLELDGGGMIHIFRGMAKIDAEYFEAVSCFRFFKTGDEVWQVQTLGLKESFGEAAQLQTLKAIEAAR